MAAAEHRIGKLVLEVDLPDRASADAFGGTVRSLFDAVIAPALESAFDRVDCPDRVLRLDRLEVDLGPLPTAVPDPQDLARRIVEGLAAVLPAAPEATRESAQGLDDDTELAEFLKTGALPWSEPGKALASLIQALAALDASGLARLATRLRVVLLRRRAAERLVYQLPAVLVRRILRALLPEHLAAPLRATFGADAPAPILSQAPLTGPLAGAAAAMIRQLATALTSPPLEDVVLLYARLAEEPPPALALAQEAFPEDGTNPSELADQATPVEDEVAARPVHAAGAVLLHPFLPDFFDRLGLLAVPGRFRTARAQERAVGLAHHLATGAEEAPEPETLLFKLLCGMDPAEPVPRNVGLTTGERDEAEALLRSVIDHWSRLGSTSPAGLREGFLLRSGRLDRRGGRWRLTVERRGVDVLLENLPWPLSQVRTPFMRSFLSVDWR